MDRNGLEKILVMWQKIKQVWEAVPSEVKRVAGFVAGAVGFLAGISAEDEEGGRADSFAGHYNYRTGKMDDGEDVYGIYDECDRLPGVPYAENDHS